MVKRKSTRIDADFQRKLNIIAEGMQELVVDAYLGRIDASTLVEYLAEAEKDIHTLRNNLEKFL